MLNRLRQFMTLIRLELAHNYRFPIIEIVCAILLYTIFTSAMMIHAMTTIYIGRDVYWNGTSSVQYINDFMIINSKNSLSGILTGLIHPLAIIVPLLTSLSIAGNLEDRTAYTILTYPVSRSIFLGAKIILSLSVTGVTTIIATIAAIGLFQGGTGSIDFIPISLVAIFLQILLFVSTTVLISVLTRKLSVATISAIGFWYAYQFLLTMTTFYNPILYSMSPLLAIALVIRGYEESISIENITFVLAGTFIFTLCLLSISFIIFNKSDI